MLAPGSVLLVDARVHELYALHYADRFRHLVLPQGEAHKTWDTVARVIDRLLEWGLGRDACLVALGGGLVCDLTGFVAAVYKRGIGLGLLPTTVLSQCDAAVGGKNGINWGDYKNQIGTVRQPDFIVFCSEWLATLPHSEYASGFAEVIKYALVFDTEFLEFLEMREEDFRRRNPAFIDHCIRRSIAHKNALVAQDPYERDRRRLLNFGHTLGHAIERHWGIPHGHAVSLGMVYALRLSRAYCDLPADRVERAVRLLQSYGLPTHIDLATGDLPRIAELLQADKKNSEQGLTWILLEELGKATMKQLSQAQALHFLHTE